MKNLLRLLGLAALVGVLAAPAYAAAGGGTEKPKSWIEFLSASENHGLPLRAVQGKYQEYRRAFAKVPATTLEVSEMRE